MICRAKHDHYPFIQREPTVFSFLSGGFWLESQHEKEYHFVG